MAQISSFYQNTTKVFSGVITHNGTNPDTTTDTITFIMKASKLDSDGDAVVDVDATGKGSGGIFTISLTPSITDDLPAMYYYEIVWHLSGGEVYVLESDTVEVKDKVQDNV